VIVFGPHLARAKLVGAAKWKEHPTSSIIDEEIVKLTSKEIVLLDSAPLRRK
jgi:hypothetical protein